METELDEAKDRSMAEVLEMQKTAYENALATMELELERLKADKESQHTKLTFLKVSRDSLNLGDVILGDIEPDHEIVAHSIILASKSEVLRKMFEPEMPESLPLQLPTYGASHPVMEAMVNFCYTGEISFTEFVRPDEVLKLAHELTIEHLRDVCVAELCRRIAIDNVLQLLNLSRTFRARRLHAEAVTFLKAHRDSFREFGPMEDDPNSDPTSWEFNGSAG